MTNGTFNIVLLEEAEQFLSTLADKAREKVTSNMRKVAGGVKDNKLFKKLEGSDDIWEFRTKYNGLEYRFLAFWDKNRNSLVVATHGFIKKRWTVPLKEIARAEELRRLYYESE
ncbi:MAG: type II toxin-antitoxin system RelE/ParE family toxin [Prevotella sp.]|nr:type II toxin-antitoxin system RelE/ParE family toxin [Prevotella sp.]